MKVLDSADCHSATILDKVKRARIGLGLQARRLEKSGKDRKPADYMQKAFAIVESWLEKERR